MRYNLVEGKDAVNGLIGIIVVATLIIAGTVALLRVLDGSTDLKDGAPYVMFSKKEVGNANTLSLVYSDDVGLKWEDLKFVYGSGGNEIGLPVGEANAGESIDCPVGDYVVSVVYRPTNSLIGTYDFSEGNSGGFVENTMVIVCDEYSSGAMQSSGGSWEEAHDAGEGEIPLLVWTSSQGGIDDFTITRMFLSFYTAPLPDNAVVTAASVAVPIIGGHSMVAHAGDGSFGVVGWDPEVPGSPLDPGDFGDIIIPPPTTGGGGSEPLDGGYVEEGGLISEEVELETIDEDGLVVFGLNGDGISWINLQGWTTLAVMEGHDLYDEVIEGENSIFADPENRPYLTVTYLAPAW